MSNFTFLALHLPSLRADAQEAERVRRRDGIRPRDQRSVVESSDVVALAEQRDGIGVDGGDEETGRDEREDASVHESCPAGVRDSR